MFQKAKDISEWGTKLTQEWEWVIVIKYLCHRLYSDTKEKVSLL